MNYQGARCFLDGHNPSKITLWLFNIAMENDPFIDDVPMNTLKTFIYSGFSMAMLDNQMVSVASLIINDHHSMIYGQR